MPPLTIARFLSLGLTALLIVSFPKPVTYYSILMSAGLAHYLCAAAYALPLVPTNFRQPRLWLLVCLLLSAAAAFAMPGDNMFKLVFFFWVHHVLNEVYLGRGQTSAPLRGGAARLAAIAFHSFLYFALLANDPLLAFLDKRLVAVGLAMTTLCYLYLRGPQADSKGRLRRRLKACSFELAAAALGAAALLGYLHLRFVDVVFYHYILWAFVPLLSSKRRNASFALRYGLETFALPAAILLVSPIGLRHYNLSGPLFLQTFYFGSYIHIMSSFALSNAQPDWMARTLRPAPISVPQE